MTTVVENSPIPFGHGTIRICRRGKNGAILLVALSRPEFFNAFNELGKLLNFVSHHAFSM